MIKSAANEDTMFTKSQYVVISDLIHARRVKEKPNDSTGERLATINEITMDFVKMFQEDNPKFKPFTFIEACNRDLKD